VALPTIPSATEIANRIIADIEGDTNQTTPALAKAFNKVVARAVAGVVILLYHAIHGPLSRFSRDCGLQSARTTR
jgi:hypothetical protein